MNNSTRILIALTDIDRRLAAIETRLDNNDAELVGIAEACRILRCTRAALYKRIARGQVNCEQSEGSKGRYKFNRAYLIKLTQQ